MEGKEDSPLSLLDIFPNQTTFPVAYFSVILFWLFFCVIYVLDLVIEFIADAACMGLRSCPFNEVTWQMLCKACMDKPCLCQALHIIVNPIMVAPQAGSMGNYPQKWK